MIVLSNGKNINPLDIEKLEEKLSRGSQINGVRFSKAGSVRFAPLGSYTFGEQTPDEFAQNGLVIASFGIEGAQKLGEVSSKFINPPRVYGPRLNGNSETRTSSLYTGYHKLTFYGDCNHETNVACAYGIEDNLLKRRFQDQAEMAEPQAA